uniref:ABC transporter subunit C n=1 Tax=Reclinomonas americana TaxID=48483 RepID=O21278_RECAM|nr:ABC transporter subunit C [Reclinomonas americana]AAD11905.1 ABC transporter subunit C [Reclinomonas americana]
MECSVKMNHLKKKEFLFDSYITLIQPSRLMSTTNIILPILLFISITLLTASLYLGIFIADTDVQQGESYRIIYIHVPSAWICLFIYILLTISSIIYLVVKNPIAFFISKSFAKIGIIFTFTTLFTGSLWGYPVWGTFWVWDARLTSVLVLFFIYLIIWSFFLNQDEKIYKIGCILTIIFFAIIPIIKYSVDWWTTLHQGSSITQFKNTIHISILLPTSFMYLSFLLFIIYIILCDLRKEILIKKVNILKTLQNKDISMNTKI